MPFHIYVSKWRYKNEFHEKFQNDLVYGRSPSFGILNKNVQNIKETPSVIKRQNSTQSFSKRNFKYKEELQKNYTHIFIEGMDRISSVDGIWLCRTEY